MAAESLLIGFDVGPDLKVVIEDDDRVAYAYLMRDEHIVADVWLYNVAPIPEQPEWHDPSEMPFLNPRMYCKEEPFNRIPSQSDVVCTTHGTYINIELDGQLIARLTVGAKPGWSRLASREGPLALPLDAPRA